MADDGISFFFFFFKYHTSDCVKHDAVLWLQTLKMSHVGLRLRRHVLRPSPLQRHQPPSVHSRHRSIFSLSDVPLPLMHRLPAAAAVVAGAFIFPALLSSYLNGSYNYLLCPETTRQMIILRSNV